MPEKTQCVIVAGGLGTRMHPLTRSYPKSLIEAGGLPFVHHQLSWLKSHGVTEVVFCIGYRGEMIRDYVGDGRRFGLSVSYVDEGNNLRGTAGALRRALEQDRLASSFLYTYGDSFLPIDFAAVYAQFQRCAQPALMCIFHNHGQWDKSNVVWDAHAQEIVLYDKRRTQRPEAEFTFIDYGLSVLRRETVESLIPADRPYDMADVFCALSQTGRLAGFEVNERFYEIGSPEGLRAFEEWLAARSG